MDRLACVNVAAFPLQLLLRDHPDWAGQPAAVVEDDRPQSPVLFVNVHARRLGVCSGQRYATALTLAQSLHAGTVPHAQIDRGVRALADRLRQFSPHVEPSTETPGVFWLDASGLGHLYPELQTWARRISADLGSVGMKAAIAVGFSRFGVFALALSHRGPVVCADAAEERLRVHRVPLARLALDPDARDRLLALGIDTVGDFLRLPGDGIRTRFGAAIDAVHRLAAGTRWAPLQPAPPDVRHEATLHFDVAESHIERLLFVIKRQLDSLLMPIARLDEAIVEVVLRLTMDDRTERVESVRPAASTLDIAQLLTLVRLRLDALQVSGALTSPTPSSRGPSAGGITSLSLTVHTCRATADQRRLLPEQSRRDAGAANKAIARLRAECGDHNVVRAHIRDAHLPSARFTWEPIESVPARSQPRVVTLRPLVRRIYAYPVPLPFDLRRSIGGAATLSGPYVVSGGWWGGGVQRDYYFVHTDTGELWWVYFDHRRRRFYLQGHVQ